MNTLYIPDLRTNLLSKSWTRVQIFFGQNGQASVQDRKEETKLVTKREGDLYILNGSVQQVNMVTQENRSEV